MSTLHDDPTTGFVNNIADIASEPFEYLAQPHGSDALRSIIAAPMAGGPSSPALVDAVAAAGALGFLAAGYLTAEALGDKISEVQELAEARDAEPFFGVNLFSPQSEDLPSGLVEAVSRYRDSLADEYLRYGVPTPEVKWSGDDHWDDKVDLLLELSGHSQGPNVVSVTFGLPPQELVDQLNENGVEVWATVATPESAVRAARLGVDGIVVQGPEAGGHRATLTVYETPNQVPLGDLIADVVLALSDVDSPKGVRPAVIAAGGIATAEDVHDALEAGADAAAAGTAFLVADEAGTNPVHRKAVAEADSDDTVVTRAFSGRPARGRKNRFIEEHDATAVAAYPAVNSLTSPIRKAATKAGDPSAVSLWAGTHLADAVPGPAAEIVERLRSGVEG